MGPAALASDLRANLPQIRQGLRYLPTAVRQLSEQASAGHIHLDMSSPEMQKIRDELAAQQQQRFWLMLAGTGIVVGSLVIGLDGSAWLGGALIAAGALAAWLGRPQG